MADLIARWVLVPDLVTGLLLGLLLGVGGLLVKVISRRRAATQPPNAPQPVPAQSPLPPTQLQVVRLHAPGDDFERFYALCRDNIPPEELEPKSEMERYLVEGERQRRALPASELPFEDYFALAKRGAKGAGILNATLYARHRVGFINYLGTTSSQPLAIYTNSEPLLEALREYMTTIGCTGLVYEIDCRGPHLSRDENDFRRSKAQRFIRLADRRGWPTYEIPVPYVQPELSILEDQTYQEVPLSLLYVPLGNPHERVTRGRLVELLTVTLLNWYLDIYDREGQLREQYRAKLTPLRDTLVAALPETVDLKPLQPAWAPPMREGAVWSPTPVGLSPARRRKRLHTQGRVL